MKKRIAGLFLILGAFIGAYSTVPAFADTINSLPQYIISKDEGTQLTARTTSLNFVGSGVTATNSGNAVTVTVSGGSLSLLTNGIPNDSQTTLNLVQDANIALTDYGSGVIGIGAVFSPAGGLGQIQFYDPSTNLLGGIPDSYSDSTGTYFNSGKLLITTGVTDRSKSGTFDAGLLDSFYTYNLPKSSGTLPLTVNGVSADDSGEITISAGSPGGSNTQLQYNNSGSFGGITGATTNGTSVTYTTGNLIGADLKASSSAGVQILGNSGTVTALFGAGGGANSTFYGGSKFDYATASTVPYFDGSKNLISSPNLLNDGIKVTVAQPVATSGSPTGLLFTGGAHTTLTASTEAIDINFNLARTVQFATGALATQRSMYIQGATYAFVGASTLTNAITLQIDAPTAGTNATITNPYALFINSPYWKYGTGVYGLRFRDNTSSGTFAAAYSTNVTPSNSNHFWMHNGVTTHINATSAGTVIISNNGTGILTVGSASVVASKLMTVTDTVAGTVLTVTNSTTSAAANGAAIIMSTAGQNAGQGILVLDSTTATSSTIQRALTFKKNNINADTTQEIQMAYSLRDNSASREAGAIAFKYSNTGSGTQVTGWTWRNLVGGTTLTDSLKLDGSDLKLLVAGGGLYVKEGTNATMGTCTLVAGTCTVSTTKVTANSRIFLTRQTTAGTLGTSVDVTARTAGTSFVITSNGSVLDTSVVAWMIVEPS
jgi:hypothetical protein